MGAEAVTKGSFGELMRSLSHKKRNGMLSLDFSSRQLRISFQEGKIVGVLDASEDEVGGICRRLVDAGCIVDKVLALVSEAGINSGQLYELLVGKQYVTSEDFFRAKRSFEMDLLYSLESLENGSANFQPKLIHVDARNSIRLYPGQLLLDVEELRGDRVRLTEISNGSEPVEVSVRDTGAELEHLTPEEQRVYDAASQSCALYQILHNCLMSQYDAIEALLSLYDQELIEFTSEVEAAAREESNIEDDSQLAPSSELVQPEISPLGVDSVVDSAAEKLREMEDPQPKSHHAAVPNQLDPDDAENSSFSFDGQFAENSAEPESVEESSAEEHLESQAEAKAIETADKSSSGGLRQMVRAGSYHLLNPDTRMYLVLVTTTVFLIGFALMGPQMFETWFAALSDFTSK